MNDDVESTDWDDLNPTEPYYFFTPHAKEPTDEYKSGWRITDIYGNTSIGVITARDKLTIHHSIEELRETVTDFAALSVDDARRNYQLRKDSKDWKVHLAQTDLRRHPDADQYIKSIQYRPFDIRWTYYTAQSRGFICVPRFPTMRHLMEENLALCTHRSLRSASSWQHVFIADDITDGNCISTNDGPTHVFPLYLYPEPDALLQETERTLNFKPAFLTALSEALGLPQTDPHQLPDGITPEQILAYIYAILYSPTYRERYYEFLRYDFPRIPLPNDLDHFSTLAALGQELIDAHLLRNIAPTTHRFEGEGDAVVERVRHEDNKVWINASQHFTDVPQDVWDYEVGAYQVCLKWLKDRKDRTLSLDELNQYRKILVAITETIRIMDAIDDINGGGT